jgi:branched-chain amino acid transport system ATP-binding protein
VSILSVAGVSAGYGDVTILQDVSIRVEANETVVMIGPNGAGKSTLLKCIAGLVRPSSGKIEVDGTDICKIGPESRVDFGLTYVPQSSNIFSALSVRENLELGLPRRTKPHQFKARVEELCELFPELSGFMEKQAVLLSGGQRQIVAVARALMRRPRLVLMDEPSAGLSPLLTMRMFEHLQKVRESGVSVLLVEQNARQGIAIADRVYVLQGGRNALEGTGKELMNDTRAIDLYLGKGKTPGSGPQ